MIQTFTITLTQKEILRALLYFDVFHYPLKADEVFENISLKLSKADLQNDLECLVSEGFIKCINGFYLIHSSSDNILERRLKGNAKAMELKEQVFKYSRLIASFPFISGVCISGGLSKNYMDEHSDIDYFIITTPNRLWLARTIFTLFYKTLSKEEKNNYCLNYFISEADLVIPDRNDFVATELAYLMPTVNYSLYRKVLSENNWYKEKFPNKHETREENCLKTPQPLLKKITELFFFSAFGNWLDDQLLRMTLTHWRKKYPEMTQEDFELQLRSRKHVCKYHTKGHQNKVLVLWQEKINQFGNLLM
ncbi:MAG: hypothetical protein HY062_11970 [Bacteroidetes bacterium]|nr:hypothetical protein [Bacteroidota bacterium]